MVTRDMSGDRTFGGFGDGKPSDSFADCHHRCGETKPSPVLHIKKRRTLHYPALSCTKFPFKRPASIARSTNARRAWYKTLQASLYASLSLGLSARKEHKSWVTRPLRPHPRGGGITSRRLIDAKDEVMRFLGKGTWLVQGTLGLAYPDSMESHVCLAEWCVVIAVAFFCVRLL